MTTFLGLDNRLLLPPFFPVERNSDGIFGLMLWKCMDESHVAFLPWILLHAPEPPRAFAPDEIWAEAAEVWMADIVSACILGHNAEPGPATAATRWANLGEHLQELGSLDIPEFEQHVRTLQQFRNFASITALHSQLQTCGESPRFWAEDIKKMIALLSKASAADSYLVPRDLRQGRDAGAARRLSQDLVGRFGQLLQAWPTLIAAATRLRMRGCRVSEAL